MNELFSAYAGEPLYIQLYMYYRDMIINGSMKHGDKLLSIRKCCAEFNLSKMTVESAYMQLVAEGYVYAKSQSGYFVSKISDFEIQPSFSSGKEENEYKEKPLFDLSGTSIDVECFDFKLWQKYIKNALRCEERLLSYGESQGEYDLRVALSEYATKERGVICNPSQIVIGAGVQNLIQLLCSLDDEKSTVIFSGTPFRQGMTVFEDFGYNVVNSSENYNGKDHVGFIYTSPSRSDEFNSVLNISDRVDMLNFARKHSSIIIEDDFDSEFSCFSRPVSSLQGLDGGENVAYIGTMSKLLLPSIRISYMVLPRKLINVYKERGKLYNQTASKTEQIALARYITDMRLVSQIRKARKHYENKTELMKTEIEKHINPVSIRISDSGFMIIFDVLTDMKKDEILSRIFKNKIAIKNIEQIEQNSVRFFVSCVSIPSSDIFRSVTKLKNALNF